MTPAEFSARILAPAAAAFPFHDAPASRALLLAIAGQESGWTDRLQEPTPFARGFWQMERGGGVLGVMEHPASREIIATFCESLEIPPDLDPVYEAIAWNDTLAYAFARLLLWTDPAPLPAAGDVAGSLAVYRRLWRPGRPDDTRWTTRYAEALAVSAPAVA